MAGTDTPLCTLQLFNIDYIISCIYSSLCCQIVGVVRNSLAVRQSLYAMIPAVASDNMCHPYITEINNRPLNLFYKDNEVSLSFSLCANLISYFIAVAMISTVVKTASQVTQPFPCERPRPGCVIYDAVFICS